MTCRVGGRVGIVQVRYLLVPVLGKSTARIELRHELGFTSYLKLHLERIGGIRRVSITAALVDQEQRHGTTSWRNVRDSASGNLVVHDLQLQALRFRNIFGPRSVLGDPQGQVDCVRLPCPDINGLSIVSGGHVAFILVVAPANRHGQGLRFSRDEEAQPNGGRKVALLGSRTVFRRFLRQSGGVRNFFDVVVRLRGCRVCSRGACRHQETGDVPA